MAMEEIMHVYLNELKTSSKLGLKVVSNRLKKKKYRQNEFVINDILSHPFEILLVLEYNT